jgi:hypothetical protein
MGQNRGGLAQRCPRSMEGARAPTGERPTMTWPQQAQVARAWAAQRCSRGVKGGADRWATA